MENLVRIILYGRAEGDAQQLQIRQDNVRLEWKRRNEENGLGGS